MTEYNIMMGMIVFPLICFFNGGFGYIIYLIYAPIKKRLIKNGKLSLKRSIQINLFYGFFLFIFSIYQTYDAFFPGESFYEDEYKYVTMREIPESATFISKTASYPDFHGDYCSASVINISPSDYQKLLNELKNDNQLTNHNMNYSEELDEVMDKNNSNEIIHSFQRNIIGEEDRHLYIGFLNDGKTIVVQVCFT